jgi:hypothetical protein
LITEGGSNRTMNKSTQGETQVGTNFYFDSLTERNDLEILDKGGRVILKGILE